MTDELEMQEIPDCKDAVRQEFEISTYRGDDLENDLCVEDWKECSV